MVDYSGFGERQIHSEDQGNQNFGPFLGQDPLANNFSQLLFGPFFRSLQRSISKIVFGIREEEFLSQINFKFIKLICELLDIKTKISWSMDYPLAEGKTERLVGLCQTLGATTYLSGPAAKDYLMDSLFEKAGVTLEYMDYSGYLPYPQLFNGFFHEVSIIDLLFNVGPETRRYMKP